jgi:hypothetical protein
VPVNHSQTHFGLNAKGEVTEQVGGQHPDAVSILAVPGGTISTEDMLKHKLTDKIKAADPNALEFDPVGNAIYHDEVSGRAHAVSLLPADDPRRIAGEAAEVDKKKELAALAAHRPTGVSLLDDVNKGGHLTGQPKGKHDAPKPDAPKPAAVPVAGVPIAPVPAAAVVPGPPK